MWTFVRTCSTFYGEACLSIKKKNIRKESNRNPDNTTQKRRTVLVLFSLACVLLLRCLLFYKKGFYILFAKEFVLPTALHGLAEIQPLDAPWMPPRCKDISILRFLDKVLPPKLFERPETICRSLETCFVASNRVCQCCQGALPDKCLWCRNVSGIVLNPDRFAFQ